MVTTDASAAPYEKGQLYQIPLTDLQADPNQPRGMVTAWNKVKEKQAKEEAPPRPTANGWTRPTPSSRPSILPPGRRRRRPPSLPPWGNSRKPSWPC
jgi:hypothetical protein